MTPDQYQDLKGKCLLNDLQMIENWKVLHSTSFPLRHWTRSLRPSSGDYGQLGLHHCACLSLFEVALVQSTFQNPFLFDICLLLHF